MKTYVEKNKHGDVTALLSRSGRTRVTAEFDNLGRTTVMVYRDSDPPHRIDLGKEID